jgi:hypothetical protein
LYFLFGTLAAETHLKGRARCTYSVTDLTSYESPPFEVALETDEAARFASSMARELLAAMPHLSLQGMCVAVYDSNGVIIPLDPVH